VFSNFFFENITFYEVMWKNIVQPGRSQMIFMAHALCMLDTYGYKYTF